MSLIELLQEEFQKQLDSHFSNIDGMDQLHKVRGKSWDHFQELGLPSSQMEVYRYIKLRKLYAQSFSLPEKLDYEKKALKKYIFPGCEDSIIVLVNGQYCPELSSTVDLSGMIVLPLADALRTYSAFFNSHLAKSLKEETDPFVSLNGALSTGGVFFYLPPKTVLEKSVQILNLIDTGEKSIIASPRMYFFIGSQSQAHFTVLNECVSGENYFSNQYLSFHVEEGAKAILNQINIGNSRSSWSFDAVRASLKRDSTFHSVAVTNGSETVRSDYCIRLIGENAEASLNGLWMLKDSREAHINVLIDHQAPHCRSLQLFKGILDDASVSSFEGKIYVRQAAQKTDAFQLNNNLLLSERANASSKPNLEIFADDVKASHGATVGQLDKEQLFYLLARGFPLDLAKKVLIRGFCQEVINLIEAGPVRDKIQEKFDDQTN